MGGGPSGRGAGWGVRARAAQFRSLSFLLLTRGRNSAGDASRADPRSASKSTTSCRSMRSWLECSQRASLCGEWREGSVSERAGERGRPARRNILLDLGRRRDRAGVPQKHPIRGPTGSQGPPHTIGPGKSGTSPLAHAPSGPLAPLPRATAAKIKTHPMTRPPPAERAPAPPLLLQQLEEPPPGGLLGEASPPGGRARAVLAPGDVLLVGHLADCCARDEFLMRGRELGRVRGRERAMGRDGGLHTPGRARRADGGRTIVAGHGGVSCGARARESLARGSRLGGAREREQRVEREGLSGPLSLHLLPLLLSLSLFLSLASPACCKCTKVHACYTKNR